MTLGKSLQSSEFVGTKVVCLAGVTLDSVKWEMGRALDTCSVGISPMFPGLTGEGSGAWNPGVTQAPSSEDPRPLLMRGYLLILGVTIGVTSVPTASSV